MEFKESVVTCLKQKYMDFSGRASRSEYWYFFLFTTAVSIIVEMLAYVLPEIITLVLSLIVTLGLILPGLAVAVRRLHDTDRTGWLLLLALIPLIGILILLYFYVQKGNDWENRFGSPTI